MSKLLKQRKKGFTLIEMLVAISIFSVSLLGIMSVLASGVSDTSYAKRKMTATYLAQEGIEYVRNIRDAYIFFPVNGGWGDNNDEDGTFLGAINKCKKANNGKDGSEYGCGIDPSREVTQGNFIFKCTSDKEKCNLKVDNGNYYAVMSNSSTDPNPDSGFTRRIWQESVMADEIKIYSKVEWTGDSGPRSVTFSENLYNWVD